MPEPKDFTKSAEKLSNPEEVKTILDYLHQAEAQLKTMQDQLEEANKELVEAIRIKQNEVEALLVDLKGDAKKGIVGAIEKYGSYQDTELQHYAVRYRRMIKSYHVEPFKKWYEKYCTAVVEEAINVKALEGLVKGKLIEQEELKKKGVIQEKPEYSYYVS